MAKIRQNKDYETLEEAGVALERETGLKVVDQMQERPQTGELGGVFIELKGQGDSLRYRVEIKNTINDITIGRLAQQFHGKLEHWLLITRYVPTEQAKKMKKLGIQFIDAVGNAYLNEKRILVFITGNKPIQPLRPIGEGGALGRAGIQVVFALFCNEGLEQKTYRDIADVANVALGTVAGVWKNLARQGYIFETGTGRRMVRKKELFDKWINEYAERLRPKNLIGRYTTNRTAFWQATDLVTHAANWGGEVAANKLTHYLEPGVITIYTHRPVNKLVLDFGLKKDETGNVELREQFWGFNYQGTIKDVVPPMLVYADLIATADARNVETAKMIYDEYLQKYIR